MRRQHGAPLSGKSLGNFEGSTGNATSEFCVINSETGRRIGDRMTFRESARATDPGATAVAPGGGLIADEPETPGALGEEAEETPRPEPLEAGASPRGEDPVRLYLKEIGKVPLLTAAPRCRSAGASRSVRSRSAARWPAFRWPSRRSSRWATSSAAARFPPTT